MAASLAGMNHFSFEDSDSELDDNDNDNANASSFLPSPLQQTVANPAAPKLVSVPAAGTGTPLSHAHPSLPTAVAT